ncbi:MAG: hypothetical protein JEZ04_01700 [Spirochaetales bacterium]|nr:hypothetical protein [Spirochaetales bacterium]
MKKTIITLFLLILVCPLFSDPFSLLNSGEYAAYHDTRGEQDFFRAYWGHNIIDVGAAFFIKNIDNKTGESINYMVQLRRTEDRGLEIEQIKGLSEDDPPLFKQSIVDLLNFIDVSSSYRTDDGERDLNRETSKYIEIYHFDSHLPLFGFNSIRLSGRAEEYKLTSAGMFDLNDISPFFELRPEDELDIPARRGLGIPQKEKVEAFLFDYRLDIDSNWSENNESGYPGYWLSLYSFRDSQIMLEKEKWSDIESAGLYSIDDFIRQTVYLTGDRIFMDSMILDINNGIYTLSYYLNDSNNSNNYVERKIWLEDDYLYILNFSSFADIYRQNPDYFDEIKASFRRK